MSVAALQWSLATPFGIRIDEEKDAWHTGHIDDMVRLDGGDAGMLVASQTGGVWIATATFCGSTDWPGEYPVS